MEAAYRICCVSMVAISFLHFGGGYVANVRYSIRKTLLDMDKELLADAQAKIDEIEDLKLKESKTTAFRQGELVYLTRLKWMRMLRIYFRCVDEMDNMTHTEMIRDMVRLQRMNMDIYHSSENMFQTEEGDKDLFVERRRSGGQADMREFLSSADASVRGHVLRRTELLRKLPSTKRPFFDIHEDLKLLDTNASELLVVSGQSTKKSFDYDPELIIPLMYK